MKKLLRHFPKLVLAGVLGLGLLSAGFSMAQPSEQHRDFNNGKVHKEREFNPDSRHSGREADHKGKFDKKDFERKDHKDMKRDDKPVKNHDKAGSHENRKQKEPRDHHRNN